MPKDAAYKKKAAALANMRLGSFEEKLGQVIVKAADEIFAGDLGEHFPLVVR